MTLISVRAAVILVALALVPALCAGAIRMQTAYQVGDVITLTGTTNLASGNQLWIEIISASFAPAQKGEDTTFSGSSGIVTVDRGTWTYTFSTAGFRQDEYLVTVEAVGIGVIDKGSFRLMDRTSMTTGITTIPTAGSPVGTTSIPITGSPTATPKAGGFTFLALSALFLLFLYRRA